MRSIDSTLVLGSCTRGREDRDVVGYRLYRNSGNLSNVAGVRFRATQ